MEARRRPVSSSELNSPVCFPGKWKPSGSIVSGNYTTTSHVSQYQHSLPRLVPSPAVPHARTGTFRLPFSAHVNCSHGPTLVSARAVPRWGHGAFTGSLLIELVLSANFILQCSRRTRLQEVHACAPAVTVPGTILLPVIVSAVVCMVRFISGWLGVLLG